MRLLSLLSAASALFLSPSPKPSLSNTSASVRNTTSLADVANTNQVLLFKHFPKAAGTFVKTLLKQVLPPQNLVLVHEFESYFTYRRTLPHAFTMSGTRNPCSWYVSLWSYGNDQKGNVYLNQSWSERTTYYGRKGPERTPEKFTKWLRHVDSAVTDKPRVGMMSARFWGGYLTSGGQQCATVATCHYFGSAVEDLNKFQVRDVADCWYQTEDVVANVRSCLKKYQKRTGGPVYWKKFEEAVSSSRRNPSHHKEPVYYITADAKKLVETRDGNLMKKFGFDCAAEGSKMPAMFG